MDESLPEGSRAFAKAVGGSPQTGINHENAKPSVGTEAI